MSDDRNWTEEFVDLQRAAWEASERARTTAAELAERLSAEVFASQGDDAADKVRLAYSRYQRDLAELSFGFWRDVADQQREANTLLEAAQQEAAKSAHEAFLGLIDQSVADIDESAARPSSKSSGGAKRATSTSSRGRSSARSKKAEK